jgi:hypothetical protein
MSQNRYELIKLVTEKTALPLKWFRAASLFPSDVECRLGPKKSTSE